MSLAREFRLLAGTGLSCDARGALIGTIPLLKRIRTEDREIWIPRSCCELSEEISSHWDIPIDMTSKVEGLRVIAHALNEGNIARAQVATVLLAIPEPPSMKKGVSSRSDLMKFIRDLHWSGMIKGDWDPDEHPRWPAGAPDSQGGRFAPKDDGGEGSSSQASLSDADDRTTRAKTGKPRDSSRRQPTGASAAGPDAGERTTRIQLADAGMSDAAEDLIVEAASRAGMVAQRDSAREGGERRSPPNIVLAAAEGEDENDPRFGIGGNHPPEELIPERLQQSPAGLPIQFLDNIFGITAPAEELNLGLSELEMRALLRRIHEIDPSYIYASIEPRGGLAGMSWQERLTVINRLRAELAATTYRVRGDIRPLQEVTLDFIQRATNAKYDEALQRYKAGELNPRQPRQLAIGNDVDDAVRRLLRQFYDSLGIPTDSTSAIRVNRRAYNTSHLPKSYRLPDARVGNLAFDVSLEAKKPSDDQIKAFFRADYKPIGVVIVRPNQLGSNSSYVIWRPNGD